MRPVVSGEEEPGWDLEVCKSAVVGCVRGWVLGMGM